MSTIPKEWLQQKIADMETARDDIPFGLDEDSSNTLAALRIALASLEAKPAIHRWRRVTSEPYGPYPWHYGDFIGFSKPVDGIEDEYFYFAPPAPAKAKAEPVAWLWSHRKHPSEVSLVRPEDDERAEGAHWSGWSCQALYAAPPAPVSVPDEDLLHMAASAIEDLLSNKDRYCAGVWADIPAKLRRAAMLQGAEPVTTACKVRDAVEIIRNSGIAIDAEKIFAERGALNAPVIADGWVAYSERMPETYVNVLLTDEAEDTCIGQLECDDDGHFCINSSKQIYKATHWMPLPAEPQQEVKP